MTIATKKATNADGGAIRDPAADVDRDLDGDSGDGAGDREPSTEKRTDGAAKREPGADDTPKPFNREQAVAELIDELGDLGDEKADDEKPGKADPDDGDGDKAEIIDDDAKDDEKPDDDEPDDKPDDDADKDDEVDEETKKDDPADDAEKDPDVPDEAELAKMPKADRKRFKRVLARMHEAEIQGKASRSIAEFAERNHMPANVLQDWLVTGAKVINAKEPMDGAKILADEVYALIEDRDLGEASDADRATALRKLADHMDPEGAKPATPVELPEALADLVEAGVLTKAAALAAHATTTAKDKPAAGKSDADKRQAREKAERIEKAQRGQRAAAFTAGQEAMKAESRTIVKSLGADAPKVWPLMKAHILKQLQTEWKDSAPSQWATIVRKEAKIYLATMNAQKAKGAAKKPPAPIRPQSGGSAGSKSKGDDLDAILAED